jgi:hypothetical protein
MHEQN